MLVMTADDRGQVRKLREAGVLEDVKAHRLKQSRGIILVSCFDGDQMYDIFETCADFQREVRENPRINPVTLGGGPLLIPERSPLIRIAHPEIDIMILGQIKMAREMKEIHSIALYAHAPCGAATKCGLNVFAIIELLIEAKIRIKEKFDGVSVACFLHVDKGLDGDGKPNKRTYFVSPTEWRRWIGINPR